MTGRLALALISIAVAMFAGGFWLVDPGWLRRQRARRRSRARGGWIR